MKRSKLTGPFSDGNGKWVIRKIGSDGHSDYFKLKSKDEALAKMAQIRRTESNDLQSSTPDVEPATAANHNIRITCFKVFAVLEDGSELLLIHDVLSDEHRTYDVEINGKTRGIWIAPIDSCVSAKDCESTVHHTGRWPSDMTNADVEEWWTKGTIRGIKPKPSNGAPF